MRIRISKDKKGNVAVLISFDVHSDRFESNYERNKFFNGLYGRNQTIKNESGEYRYRRDGLLDEVPHIKVGSSMFIVALKQMEVIMNYMKEWEEKIDCEFFKILLDQEKYKKLKKIRVGDL